MTLAGRRFHGIKALDALIDFGGYTARNSGSGRLVSQFSESKTVSSPVKGGPGHLPSDGLVDVEGPGMGWIETFVEKLIS